jgi:iron complex outermembrane receptor protein
VEGAVGGPVTEKLGARLAFRYSGYDNPVQYYNTDNPVTRPWDMAVRGTLAWTPDSKTSATFIASHEQIENRATLDVLMPYGDDPEVDVPKDSYDEDKSIERVSLELKHEFDNFIGSSLTGYSYADQERKSCIYNGITFRKYLGMTGDGSWRWGYQEDTFNQEFRLSSKPKDKIFWVAGVSGNISERDVDSKDSYDNFRPSYWMNAVYDKNFTTYSGGIFGEATYPLTEKLKVTGGIRYSWERKEYSANWAAKPSNPSPIRTARDSHELNDDYPTGRAALSYEAIENLNLYAVYARGYKSGGFSEYATGFINGIKSDLIYKPAVVDSYEVGFKSELPNLNAGISGAFFYNDTRDEHLLVFDSSTYVSVPENFDTRSMGVELNGYWKIGYGFTLSAGGGYTDAEIKSVPGDSVSGAEKGNRVPDTPKWNATVSLGHALPLPDFLGMHSPVLTSKITNRYIGERYGSADNYFKLDSYNELDLKISLAGEHVEIYLWADNLLDERYELSAWYFGQSFVDGSLVSIAVPSRGRVIGGGLAYYF